MTIHELQTRIKSFFSSFEPREFYTAALIILVGFASFGLGRITKLEDGKEPIRIEQGASAISSILPPILSKPARLDFVHAKSGGEGTGGVVVSQVNGQMSKVNSLSATAGQLVASRTGSKYHFPWCSGAGRISDANKIWFNSIEEARKAGYMPAANCKGLK